MNWRNPKPRAGLIFARRTPANDSQIANSQQKQSRHDISLETSWQATLIDIFSSLVFIFSRVGRVPGRGFGFQTAVAVTLRLKGVRNERAAESWCRARSQNSWGRARRVRPKWAFWEKGPEKRFYPTVWNRHRSHAHSFRNKSCWRDNRMTWQQKNLGVIRTKTIDWFTRWSGPQSLSPTRAVNKECIIRRPFMFGSMIPTLMLHLHKKQFF